MCRGLPFFYFRVSYLRLSAGKDAESDLGSGHKRRTELCWECDNGSKERGFEVSEKGSLSVYMEGIAKAALSNRNSVSEIHIEPYHRLGISKAGQLGMTPTYKAEVPDKDFVRDFADALQRLCGERITVKVN